MKHNTTIIYLHLILIIYRRFNEEHTKTDVKNNNVSLKLTRYNLTIYVFHDVFIVYDHRPI